MRWDIQHTYREGNRVAHIVPKLGVHSVRVRKFGWKMVPKKIERLCPLINIVVNLDFNGMFTGLR